MKTAYTCKNGHTYYKSSNCKVCPICEKTVVSDLAILNSLAAPARIALESINIYSLKQLSKYSEKEILNLHGVGPSTIPKLKKALIEAGLSFKK
ncbi:MAG: hypothetical protein ACK50A_13330 [Sphingobacteriaceae bacterium]|jgi:hypothetical protein